MVCPYDGILFSHKKEVLTCATKLMNLENLMLSGRSQRKRPYIVLFCIYKVPLEGLMLKLKLQYFGYLNGTRKGEVRSDKAAKADRSHFMERLTHS